MFEEDISYIRDTESEIDSVKIRLNPSMAAQAAEQNRYQFLNQSITSNTPQTNLLRNN